MTTAGAIAIFLFAVGLAMGFAIGWLLQLKPLIKAACEAVMDMHVGAGMTKVEDHHAVDEISQTLGVSRRYAAWLLALAKRHYPGVKHVILRTY
jgi:hypothetical protein